VPRYRTARRLGLRGGALSLAFRRIAALASAALAGWPRGIAARAPPRARRSPYSATRPQRHPFTFGGCDGAARQRRLALDGQKKQWPSARRTNCSISARNGSWPLLTFPLVADASLNLAHRTFSAATNVSRPGVPWSRSLGIPGCERVSIGLDDHARKPTDVGAQPSTTCGNACCELVE